MEVIFMNRLSKLSGQHEEHAQLWIGEEEGAWHLGWSHYEEGDREDSIWYEGVPGKNCSIFIVTSWRFE